MVMVTRSARRRACEVFDDNSSDNASNVPPWCSLGNPNERKKPREIPSSICEMRSQLLWPKNVWKIPYKNTSVTNSSCSPKRKIKSCQGKTTSRVGKCKKLLFMLLILMTALGVHVIQQALINVKPKSTHELLSLMGIDKTLTVPDEECCYKMKLLSAALLKAEQTLRRTRRQHTLQLTAQSTKLDARAGLEADFISGAAATTGGGTVEWGSRAVLWGVVPLWKTSPSPQTLLSSRVPTPADCWPFSGSRGEVIIELPRLMRIRSMSVEHVRPDAARSAPGHFVLYVIVPNGTWIKSVTGEYTYDGPPKQFFSLPDEVPSATRVAFRVLSNQGNKRYTCVYRVHVYGKDVVS